MDLADVQKTSHKIAMDHGFWSTEEDRNIPSKLALMHSEVSEALGEYREGRMELYYEHHGKGPITTPESLARGLDETALRAGHTYGVHEKGLCRECDEAKPEGFGIELADTIIRVCDLAEHLGIDLNEMIRLKFEYNIGRPFKHGRRV